MKKYFVLAAAAVMVMASCTKEESGFDITENANEACFTTFVKSATRGYVTANSFYYISGDANLRNASGEVVKSVSGDASSDAREMKLGVYNVEAKSDLFKDMTYKLDKTDGIWHASPRQYYPIGYNNFSFLGYSANLSYAADWENANKVTLEVTEESTKDDILYAGGINTAKSHKATPMLFGHAQAWITICVTASCDASLLVSADATGSADASCSADATQMKIKSIDWKNIYNSGELVLAYASGDLAPASSDATINAKAKWNFFTQEPKASYQMDDLFGNYDKYVRVQNKANKSSYWDMLVPAQDKAVFTITYTLGDNEFTYELNDDNINKLNLNDGNCWEMGKHYIYNLNFQINEITVAPSVVAWVEVPEEFDI